MTLSTARAGAADGDQTRATGGDRGLDRGGATGWNRRYGGGRREQARPPALLHREGAVRRDTPRFRAAAAYATRGNTSGVAVADLDGDGHLDLAAANRGSNGVDVLLGRGNGEFGAPTTYASGRDPFTVAVADVDGDGKPDLVAPNRLSNDVTVLLGRGDGTFGAPAAFAAGHGPEDVAVADLDGDGKLDLAVADIYGNSVSVLLGRGDGTFGARPPSPPAAATPVAWQWRTSTATASPTWSRPATRALRA